RVTAVLGLGRAVLITPMLPEKVLLNELFSMHTLLLTGEQLLWGMLFGMAMQLVFVALQAAGHILSMNMGLGMAMMNDPVNGSSTTVISQMIYTFCGLLFFVMVGHLLVVTILYKGVGWWRCGRGVSKRTHL